MKTQSYLFGVLVIVLALTALGGAGYLAVVTKTPPAPNIATFLDCTKAGYPVFESNPEECKSPDGRSFFAEVTVVPATETPTTLPEESIASATNTPTLTKPNISEKIKSPLTVAGSVIGTWYFEGSFPIVLTDTNGKVLAQASAKAIGDWMSTSSVPFSATLSWATSTATSGVLILKKDNPSGIPGLDSEAHFQITL